MSFPRYDGPFGPPILAHLKEEILLVQKDAAGVYQRSPSDAVAFQAMMTMDKYDAASEIRALDRRGQYVVLDRYWPSACCYGADDGLDFHSMVRINSCLPPADLYVLLDIPSEMAAERRPTARDRYERDKEKLKRVRDRYLYMWDLMGQGNMSQWMLLNGQSSPAHITDKIIGRLKEIVASTQPPQPSTGD
jgi:thymidylate kinase